MAADNSKSKEMNLKYILCSATALLGAVVALGAPKTDSVVCRIEGRVVGRPEAKELLLSLQNSHPRFVVPIRIPIVDSAFAYTLTVAAERPYQLLFAEEEAQGSWISIPFIAEGGTVRFVLYPQDQAYEKNSVSGGKLNARYDFLNKQGLRLYPLEPLYELYEQLSERGELDSEAYRGWIAEIEAADDHSVRDSLYRVRDRLEAAGERYSAQGKALKQRVDSTQRLQAEWLLSELQCVRRPSAADLAVLYEKCYSGYIFKDKEIDTARYRRLFETKYAGRFSDHPLVDQIRTITERSMAIGEMLPDAVAVDPTSGKRYSVLEQIKGKVAVVDLWASWCGPCMRLSSSIVPIYDRYKDRGFTVVGIAREEGSAGAMQKAVERLGLPWLNLVELNDQGQVWLRYGIDNAAGGVVLVDKTGKIVAKDFTASELEAHLGRLLD